MKYDELTAIIKNIQDCDNFIEGRQYSNKLKDIAESAAKREVMRRRENLIDRLREAGLQIDEKV